MSTLPTVLPGHDARRTDNENLGKSKAEMQHGRFPKTQNLSRHELKGFERWEAGIL